MDSNGDSFSRRRLLWSQDHDWESKPEETTPPIRASNSLGAYYGTTN